MKKKEVVIVTGGKGGTGKSVFALCLLLEAVDRGWRSVGIDLNVNNPDLAEILRTTHLAVPHEKVDRTPADLDYAYSLEQVVPQRLYGVIPYRQFRLFDIKYFYRFIANVVDTEREARFFVVDTGLNLPLVTPSMDPPLPGETHFTFAHIWSLVPGIRPSEKEALDRSLVKMRQVFGADFDASLVHIFSPRFFVPRGSKALLRYHFQGQFHVASVSQLEKTLNRLERLSPRPLKYEEVLNGIIFEASQRYMSIIGGTRALSKERMVQLWMDVILDFLQDLNGYPTNLLVVPTVFYEIAYLVEDLILQTAKTLHSLREKVAGLTTAVSRFMDHYYIR